MKKNKINYGKTDLIPDVIDRKDESIRISIVIEGDLLDDIKAKADEAGLPYQTFMKMAIKQFMRNGTMASMEARLNYIEHRMAELSKQSKDAQMSIRIRDPESGEFIETGITARGSRNKKRA